MNIGIGTLIAIALISLTGCASSEKNATVPCGVTDYIELPKGSKVMDVPLPTDENKRYTIITEKNGFWMTFECHNRLEKVK